MKVVSLSPSLPDFQGKLENVKTGKQRCEKAKKKNNKHLYNLNNIRTQRKRMETISIISTNMSLIYI